MKKMKILFGPAQSGKTEAAKEMTKGNKAVWIDSRNPKLLDTPYFLCSVNRDTEVIVFDDVPIRHLKDLMGYLYPDQIKVDRKGEEAFFIPRPDVIITVTATDSELPSDNSTKRRFDFIQWQPIDPPAAPSIEVETIPLSLQKLQATKVLMTEIRNIQIKIQQSMGFMEPSRPNLHNYFWFLMGFAEEIIDRMISETETETNWLQHVESKIEMYKAVYKIENL